VSLVLYGLPVRELGFFLLRTFQERLFESIQSSGECNYEVFRFIRFSLTDQRRVHFIGSFHRNHSIWSVGHPEEQCAVSING
jgi:hypothetical protein